MRPALVNGWTTGVLEFGEQQIDVVRGTRQGDPVVGQFLAQPLVGPRENYVRVPGSLCIAHAADATVGAIAPDRGPDVGTGMDDNTTTDPKSNRTRTWIIRIAIGVVALIAVAYGAIFIYANFINDSPDALDEGDLSEAVADPTASEGTSSDVTGSSAPGDTAADTSPDGTSALPDGIWTPTDASEFGYRVEEVLAGINTTAVGRSNEIEGTLEIADSTAEVFVENEQAFRQVVLEHGYDGVFRDRFAGDFGHWNQVGNRLVVTNLVETVFDPMFFYSPGAP